MLYNNEVSLKHKYHSHDMRRQQGQDVQWVLVSKPAILPAKSDFMYVQSSPLPCRNTLI